MAKYIITMTVRVAGFGPVGDPDGGKDQQKVITRSIEATSLVEAIKQAQADIVNVEVIGASLAV